MPDATKDLTTPPQSDFAMNAAAIPAARGGFRFDNSWHRDLPGNYIEAEPDTAPNPQLLILNRNLCQGLGLDAAQILKNPGWLAGGSLPDGAAPIAIAYAGHQFGGFNPQLGDGRAHLLGEHIDLQGRRWDLQLKGSGRTAFSRGGDGKAVLGPMLREYLISEAMAALGIPTTRSLGVALTGEKIFRDGGQFPGAVVARIAASHLRIGSFQFHAARRDEAQLRRLTDYAIARHDPDLQAITDEPSRVLAFFDRVCARQAKLIAAWMGVGFIHGVMNTDNMTISGETIDYGPCAFMEAYAPGTVFSSIDRQGRYAYSNQPLILAWNLARLAEALLPLLGPQDQAIDLLNERLEGISVTYRAEWLAVMRRKLALNQADSDQADTDQADLALAEGFIAAMSGQNADWTLSFRRLADAAEGREAALTGLFEDASALRAWLVKWRARLTPDAPRQLRAANPLIIPRNHLVEAALTAATAGDMAPVNALLAQITDPYRDGDARHAFALPAPSGFDNYTTYCGT